VAAGQPVRCGFDAASGDRRVKRPVAVLGDMTETRRVQLVDAFTEEPMAGNPAGVVTEATDLTADQMQAIATELGASETVFVRQSDAADHRLRYFSPETEVDLCGHATVAAMAALYDRAQITADPRTVETNVGVLDVDVEADGTVWLTQSGPEIRPVDLDAGTVADALGLEAPALTEVGADLPLSFASTGFPFLVVPVSYFEQLSAVTADQEAVADLCESVGAEGLYAFTFDTLDGESTLHGRAFVPLAGIPEDPVTGTASGAVCAYLRHHGAVDQPDPLVCEQGHFLDRPGRVFVRTGHTADDGTGDPGVGPVAPTVGGRAVTVLDGDLTVPVVDGDDIIEA
jgi:PhzF family phenazine biosynthesis protein